MQGQVLLLISNFLSVYSQFSVTIAQDNADVASGDSSLCWVDKLDSSIFYTGSRPRLMVPPRLVIPASLKIAYMSLYSCHGITVTELQKWEKASHDWSSAAYLNVKDTCG